MIPSRPVAALGHTARMTPESQIDEARAAGRATPAQGPIDAARARLIGLDWGTTSLRGWLFDEAGQVLDRHEAPLGILAVRNGEFGQAFESCCAPWLAARRGLPVIASGMIGSRQGWREARYLETPTRFDALAEGLLGLDDEAGRPFRIVPGLVTRAPGGSPDVLRGEETQVFGALAAAGEADCTGERLFVLPGTHSKWVAVQDGAITGFRSYMTGELYAVMREHSILGRLCAEPIGRDETESLSSFDDGVDRGFAEPGAMSHLLFTVRTEGLLGERSPEHLPAYLSGLLIGVEIADALRSFSAERGRPNAGEELAIIASPTLAARYLRALRRTGIAASLAGNEPASAGLYALARRAHLTVDH